MYEYFIGFAGVFETPLSAILFTFVQFAFMATESRRRRLAPADAVREKPPFPSVQFAILVGLFARLVLGFLKIGALEGPARTAMVYAGYGMLLGGWLLRYWAQRELGKFFTGEVAVQRDHAVISSGLYRWVRHPAYTGGVLSAFGFGMVLSTWLGAAISGVLLIWAYVNRVPREEALLAQQIGEPYRAYMARTWRFVPWIF